MSEAYNANRETIGSLLGPISRDRVVVPTFQRGYMWQTKHVSAFWDDVVKQQGASKLKGGPDTHFLGPIVTLWKSEERIIQILDGQQRLATATILLSVIRDIARMISQKTGIQKAADFAAQVQFQYIEKEDGGFSLKMGETDAAYFEKTIQLDPPVKTAPKLRTHLNIRQAYKVLTEKVTAFTGQVNPQMDSLQAIGQLKELRQTIVSDLVMARIPVTSQRSAFRIFETLNDRGLRLSAPDLLLNYLMGEAPDSEHKDIRDLWTEMIERMGRYDINPFLRHMWISKYGDLKKEDLFTALSAHIKKHSISSLDFARTCADECENYVQIITIDEAAVGKDAAPYLRALVQELSFQPAFPLLLSTYLRLQPPDFVDVAKWLLV